MKNETKTYGEIFKEFKESVGNIEISDYRPCGPPYCGVYIPNSIIVWLKNGSTIIYTTKQKGKSDE